MSDTGPDPSRLPLGYLGIVAPMNSLGFAPNPGLGLVYDGAFVLLPAQQLVFSVQRRKAAEEVQDLPYEEALARRSVRVHSVDEMSMAELTRPFTGHRLTINFVDGTSTRYILQKESVDDVKRCFDALLGDRFRDGTAPGES